MHLHIPDYIAIGILIACLVGAGIMAGQCAPGLIRMRGGSVICRSRRVSGSKLMFVFNCLGLSGCCCPD